MNTKQILIFHPIKKQGKMGFAIWLGGVLSSQLNEYAIPLNAWVETKDICKVTGVIISIWRDNGERDKRPIGRFRFFIDEIGITQFRKKIEHSFG